MRRALSTLTILAAVAAASLAAHEGHAHKVMGTACAVHVNRLDVRAMDGKTQTLTLTEKTKVVRGGTAVKASEIQPGYRVVVTATETKRKDGTTALVASRVQLGLVAPAAERCAAE